MLLSKCLYQVGNFAYLVAIYVASAFNLKAKKMQTGRRGQIDAINAFAKQNKKPVIWMHCASLGEFEQGKPVLEALTALYYNYSFVVTFFSSSGYEIQKNFGGAIVFYLPYNTPKNAHHFIQTIQPSLVLWVKYDYWSNYLLQLKLQQIPTLLISAVYLQGQPFAKVYGAYWVSLLQCFTQLFVQNENSIKYLAKLKITNVTVAGDTRFDRVVAIAQNPLQLPIIKQFCNNQPTLVAGSTWLEDEEALCHYANNNTHLKFIIAPHHINEIRLKEIEKLFTNTIRYSAYKNTEANVLLIDNIGMLSSIYYYATIAYIGGGFGSDGIHNILEAAVYGKPTIIGPNYEKYNEAIDLIEAYAAFEIKDAVALEAVCNDLLTDAELYNAASKAAINYVQSNNGATATILNYIVANRLLTNP